jgi:surface antigen
LVFAQEDIMTRMKVAIVAIVTLALAGCLDGSGPKQTIGTLGGAAGGALIGSQIGGGKGKLAAVAVGALLGAYAGGELGKSLDRADRLYAERNAQQTLETAPIGQTSGWTNPDSGHSGTITPTRTYQTASTGPCREYTQTVNIGGQTEQAYGTACRQPDGSWKVINQ